MQRGASHMPLVKTVGEDALNLSLVAFSFMTMNFQGCLLSQLGAHLPASRRAWIFSSSMGLASKWMTLRLCFIALRTGFSILKHSPVW